MRRSVRVGVGQLAQHLDLPTSIVGSKDGGTGDEIVRTRSRRALDCGPRDTAVDLDGHLQPGRVDRTPRALDLRDHLLDEGLTAKPGFDSHDEDHVELVEDVDEGRDIGGGLEGKARTCPEAVKLASQP